MNKLLAVVLALILILNSVAYGDTEPLRGSVTKRKLTCIFEVRQELVKQNGDWKDFKDVTWQVDQDDDLAQLSNFEGAQAKTRVVEEGTFEFYKMTDNGPSGKYQEFITFVILPDGQMTGYIYVFKTWINPLKLKKETVYAYYKLTGTSNCMET